MEAKYWDICVHVKPQAKRVNPILNEYYNLPWRYVKLLKGDFGFIKDCFHTRAHLRISALLRIWQVSACMVGHKMVSFL